ncbi:hypothetical protein K2X85_12970 [bacterium]|jgi:hypothetical protein|nr:hypothetical protein [bacterium]
MMMNFEEDPPRFALADENGVDETDVNLREYLEGLSAAKISQYRPDWTDEQVMAWEENFRDDGHLLLVCCTRDVAVDEYREALEALLARRQQSTTSP